MLRSPLLFQQKTTTPFQGIKAMADQAGLRRIGFAFSGIVAIVALVAAATVSASIGVP